MKGRRMKKVNVILEIPYKFKNVESINRKWAQTILSPVWALISKASTTRPKTLQNKDWPA